jgi:hypothetical protein
MFITSGLFQLRVSGYDVRRHDGDAVPGKIPMKGLRPPLKPFDPVRTDVSISDSISLVARRLVERHHPEICVSQDFGNPLHAGGIESACMKQENESRRAAK